MRPSQSGNIIIYVLGAILLLGLLIIMVRGASTPGSNIDAEQLSLKVNEVQQYGAELERAVQFILQNGYSETDIRFAHPDAHADYSSAGDIDNEPGRQVFSKQGGGATFREPPSGIQTTPTPWVFTGVNNVQLIGKDTYTDDSTELLAILPYITESFCVALNRAIGVPSPDDPLKDFNIADITTRFAGTYAYSNSIAGDTDGRLKSRREGCFEGGGTPAAGTYHYYRVLHAR